MKVCIPPESAFVSSGDLVSSFVEALGTLVWPGVSVRAGWNEPSESIVG